METLRGDLGLFGFPPKALHYRFLSKFKPARSRPPPPTPLHHRAPRGCGIIDAPSLLPRAAQVLFLRPRAYSKSVNVAPFLVNYSGALFREYPGPWQARWWRGARACTVSGAQPPLVVSAGDGWEFGETGP